MKSLRELIASPHHVRTICQMALSDIEMFDPEEVSVSIEVMDGAEANMEIVDDGNWPPFLKVPIECRCYCGSFNIFINGGGSWLHDDEAGTNQPVQYASQILNYLKSYDFDCIGKPSAFAIK